MGNYYLNSNAERILGDFNLNSNAERILDVFYWVRIREILGSI